MRILENLYLSKKKDHKVLIDTGLIAQHQLDGIRFLYRQFVTEKQGIVFNDPCSVDRSDSIQQIILFLEAVKSELGTPALILCNEDDISKWLEHFQQRKSLNVVAFEDPKPWRKDIVYIHDMANMSKLSRDGWSFVIVDDDTVSKQMLRTVFKAKFKIWITSLDMKNYLKILSSVLQWLHPNDKFTIEDFTGSDSDALNEVDKEIMLDAFLEDIVLRRKELKLSVSYKPQNTPDPGDINLKNVSRKNKDVTGTKIKRTKRKVSDSENNQILKTKRRNVIDSDSEDFVVSTEKHITEIAENNSKVIKISDEINRCKTNFDFIYNKEIKTSNEKDCLKSDNDHTSYENDVSDINCSKMTDNEAINVDFDKIEQQRSNIDKSESNFDFILYNKIETSSEKNTLKSDKDKKEQSNENISEIETNSYPESSNNSNKINDIKAMNLDFQEMSQEAMCFKDAIKDIVDHENTVVSEMNNEIDVTINTENETQDTLSVSKKISNIDTQLELDQNIIKKFKGSLLDSIF